MESQLRNKRVYMIWDLINQVYWTSPKGKNIWDTPMGGPITYNYHKKHSRESFQKQGRYTTHEFTLELVPF